MHRLLVALAAVTMLSASSARAQATQAAEAAPGKEKAPAAARPAQAAQPAPTPSPAAPPASPPAAAAPVPGVVPAPTPAPDPVRDAIRREVERAKEEMRDEIRAEIQGAQSAREFMQTSAAGERPKLDFLQLGGYLRVRGDLLDNLDLHRSYDPSGYYLFPRPLLDPEHRGTLTSANMRLRVEPTLNVSEQVRVLAQLDLLDNLVLGSTPEGLYGRTDRVQFPGQSTTQVPPVDGVNADRSSIAVKRAWAEVQTPVGLLSFGRMASSWGLGMLAHAGGGLDDDRGDTVDRLQFALTPLKTPIGPLVLVPMYEIVASGVSSMSLVNGRGLGQPFDRDQADDAKALGLKVVRVDTDEEVRRKLERDEASTSFGAWYMYKSQSYEMQGSATATSPPSAGEPVDNGTGVNTDVGGAVKRDASAHVLDLWWKRQTKRFRLEAELAGVYGQIGNASNDPAQPLGPVLLRQFGGVGQAAWKLADGKLTLGTEAGFASGDTNPGFGNRPGRGTARCASDPTRGCDFDGSKFDPGIPGDPTHPADRVLDIRNFRFNPAYRVDLILWREIIQGVTGAFYLKPNARYELIEGLAAQAALVYSQAIYARSTPSGVHTPLGIELDLGLSYRSDDGFVVFVNYGLLQPLDGMGYPPNGDVPGHSLSRAHAIRSGVAVKF